MILQHERAPWATIFGQGARSVVKYLQNMTDNTIYIAIKHVHSPQEDETDN